VTGLEPVDGAEPTVHEARPATVSSINKEARGGEETAHRQAPVTAVFTEFKYRACRYRLLYGEPFRTTQVAHQPGYRRFRNDFTPGSRFILDLWRRNDYGTLQWRCYVCETVGFGETANLIPTVHPGARILLSTQGAGESKTFLAWLYENAKLGIHPLQVPRETFEAAHFRLHGSRVFGLNPRVLSGEL
jgi:hypothetical protein